MDLILAARGHFGNGEGNSFSCHMIGVGHCCNLVGQRRAARHPKAYSAVPYLEELPQVMHDFECPSKHSCRSTPFS